MEATGIPAWLEGVGLQGQIQITEAIYGQFRSQTLGQYLQDVF